jgi:prevent-host-death family protein
MKTVGVYEAKTHLPQLLDEVGQGETIVITRHGKPVARLMPLLVPRRNIDDVIAEMQRLRERTLPDPEGKSLKDLIHEGHKY